MLVKNSMPYIMASLQSFLEQDYKNKELIIVYSKSNDGSFEYLNNKKTKNIKIYFLNKNLYSCLNYGIKKSKGEVIGILHSDDILYDKNVNVLKIFSCFVHSDILVISYSSLSIASHLLGNKNIIFITVAGRSNALSGVVVCNTHFPVIACPPFKDKNDMHTNIHSTLQMPSKVPTMTILEPNNVALACDRIFNLS